MLIRVSSFMDFFGLDKYEREATLQASSAASQKTQEMMHNNDYIALGAILQYLKPKRIFEIGTYLGVTSDFCLTLLPASELVSIAYVNPAVSLSGKMYNNSELPQDRIGSGVHLDRRTRFVQLLGDSHTLCGRSVVLKFGFFDLVIIDGDHSTEGVTLDTVLAKAILPPSGVICWHDANPKPKYMDVRRFLESATAFTAVATIDTYTGGVAAWSRDIEIKLKRQMS